ncbi:MAG: hypothetical protein MI700_10930 [Balneolales bacterium]|nr:hypothetical protein [Balneolales bacterium]
MKYSILAVALFGCAIYYPSNNERDEYYSVRVFEDRSGAYYLVLPNGVKESMIYGDHEKETNIFFPDSSLIFITNDLSGISFANTENLKGFDFGFFYDFKTIPDPDVVGIQLNGKVWRQKKDRGVVIGYLNVDPSRKKEFDKIIDQLELRTFRRSNNG